MGWLWSDYSSKTRGQDVRPTELKQSVETQHDFTTQERVSTAMKQATKEDIEQQDFNRLLQEFQATPTSVPSKPSTSEEFSAQDEVEFENTTTWQRSTLHPTTMSCTSAFDQAIYCQLLGGQFVNYYRHGTMRDCSELWSNFWFCTRTNRGFMSEDERERRIQAFYKAREARLRREGSSEDYWEAREEDEIPRWAETQFRWDLRKWEKGEAVLRKDS